MAITRTSEVTVADAWGNDHGGVTLEVGDARATLSIEEAEEYGRQVLNAALDAAQAIRERNQRPVDETPL